MSIKRAEIYKFIDKNFSVKPEFPFATTPTNAIFREKRSEKWLALLMDLDASKFGLEGGKKLILNLKCDPNLVNILIDSKEIFPAYHMNKKHSSCVIASLR
ncbi:MAG: MmcQ/YjbR family DNA-binding protein [Campylobacteraceae bacterium]|nr:MmcQ/YjbR family DNA-binding protein [Campylobacteraceae bacterium]